MQNERWRGPQSGSSTSILKIHLKVKVIQIYGVESNERKHLEIIIHIVYGKYYIEMQLLYYIIIMRGTIVLKILQFF